MMVIGMLSFGFMVFLLGLRLRLFGARKLLQYFILVAAAVTSTYFLLNTSTQVPWFYIVIVAAISMPIGYTFHDFSKRFLPSKVMNTGNLYLAKLHLDFRTEAVMAGLVAAYIVTFYFAWQSKQENIMGGFWFSFYASWISGLVLFSVVGIVVGLVSLYRPERDVFDARIKILVGGKSGHEVKHLADDIRKHAYYAKEIRRKVTFQEYDDNRKAILIRVEHISILENIFYDVPTTVSGKLVLEPDKFDPPFPSIGQVYSFRVNSDNIKKVPIDIKPTGLSEEWNCAIPGGGDCMFRYEYQCWYDINQTHSFVPSRYTKELSVEFKSRCALVGQRILLKMNNGQSDSEDHLDWDAEHTLRGMREIAPRAQAYEFKISITS